MCAQAESSYEAIVDALHEVVYERMSTAEVALVTRKGQTLAREDERGARAAVALLHVSRDSGDVTLALHMARSRRGFGSVEAGSPEGGAVVNTAEVALVT